MCTASNYITDDHYFGRNFDYEISYNERVTITPRNYKFEFRKIDAIESHYAIIGIAAAVALFKSGHYIWALICIAGGIAANIGFVMGELGSGGGSTDQEEECPYCASGDTGGNHCYNCDDDF